MSLFQRMTGPPTEPADDYPAEPYRRPYRIGDLLQARREELGLDLDAVGEALRIKPVYLAALEQGRTHDLPGPAYAVGFVRAYAQYLGLDSEQVLESYKAEGEVQARPDLALPVPLEARSVPGGALVLVAVILALLGYGTWYYLSTGERSPPEQVAAVPAAMQPPPVPPLAAPAPHLASGLTAPRPGGAAPEPAAANPTPEPAAAPPQAAPAAATPAPKAVAEKGEIEIRARVDCWIQVRTANNAIVFSRVLKAGDTYRVPRRGLFLRTGNAGALSFIVDGKEAPSIGGIGTLRRKVALDPQALLAGTAVEG